MSWISVDDHYPDSVEDVLVYSPIEGCFRAWFDNGTWLSHESANKSTPTHWMPMPKAPRAVVSNGSCSFGMTDKLITSETRPYSVWSEKVDTARDIRLAWETRFGGPYKIFKNNNGYQVKYMGEWSATPLPQ